MSIRQKICPRPIGNPINFRAALCALCASVANPPNRDHSVAFRPPLSATLGIMPSPRLSPNPSRQPVEKRHLSKKHSISSNHPYYMDKKTQMGAFFPKDLSTNSANRHPNGSQMAVKWHSGSHKWREIVLMNCSMRLTSGLIILYEAWSPGTVHHQSHTPTLNYHTCDTKKLWHSHENYR